MNWPRLRWSRSAAASAISRPTAPAMSVRGQSRSAAATLSVTAIRVTTGPSWAWKAVNSPCSRSQRAKIQRTAVRTFSAFTGVLVEAMAGARVQLETDDALQLRDPATRLLAKGRLAVEGVEHDPLEQVAQGDVVVVGEGLQHLQQALLEAHPCLHPFDPDLLRRPLHPPAWGFGSARCVRHVL